jgi:hypothetical protein
MARQQMTRPYTPETLAGKRDWLFVGCERGHDWHSLGGCNAGCHDDCSCSVPVHLCRRCGDCDYGDNEDAEQVRQECAEKYGAPSERFAEAEA